MHSQRPNSSTAWTKDGACDSSNVGKRRIRQCGDEDGFGDKCCSQSSTFWKPTPRLCVYASYDEMMNNAPGACQFCFMIPSILEPETPAPPAAPLPVYVDRRRGQCPSKFSHLDSTAEEAMYLTCNHPGFITGSAPLHPRKARRQGQPLFSTGDSAQANQHF